MKPSKSWRFAALGTIAVGALVALGVACTGDDNTGAPPGTTNDSGTSDTSTNPGTDTGLPDTGPTLAPPGCFNGTPTTSLEFQNACTSAAYVVFDNCARLGLCDGGALPPLVTPPVDAGPDAAPDASDSGGGGDASDASDASSASDAPAEGG